MASIDDIINTFKKLELHVNNHKKLLFPINKKWVYTFPGIKGEPELTTTTDNIQCMITDIRDWYDYNGLEPWLILEDKLKTYNSENTIYISFERNGMKTEFDFNPKDWMIKIQPITVKC